jgi:hypothetical protein
MGGEVSDRPVRRLLRLAVVVTVLLVAASYSVYKVRRGDWFAVWVSVALTDVRHDSGLSYQARTAREDLSSHERPSPAIVFEDGRPVGPPNASHADARRAGGDCPVVAVVAARGAREAVGGPRGARVPFRGRPARAVG